MQNSPLPDLSPAQSEIMEIVWERREVTTNEVRRVLARSRDVARNTVRTLLERMEVKGWLTHRAEGRTFLYAAARPKPVTIGQKVREVVETICGGSPETLVTALLDYRGLRPDELTRIRKLLAQAQAAENRKTQKAGKEVPDVQLDPLLSGGPEPGIAVGRDAGRIARLDFRLAYRATTARQGGIAAPHPVFCLDLLSGSAGRGLVLLGDGPDTHLDTCPPSGGAGRVARRGLGPWTQLGLHAGADIKSRSARRDGFAVARDRRIHKHANESDNQTERGFCGQPSCKPGPGNALADCTSSAMRRAGRCKLRRRSGRGSTRAVSRSRRRGDAAVDSRRVAKVAQHFAKLRARNYVAAAHRARCRAIAS